MYHKHSTEGIVIKGRERGEGNKIITLLSKEFGLIYASVQNARSINSKLRSGVEDMTLGNFSLIRGRHGWKLVGAEAHRNFWAEFLEKDQKRMAAQMLYLVSRIGGEEKNEELYSIVNNFLKVLGEEGENKSERIKKEEVLSVLKILRNLGYVKETINEIELISEDRKRGIAAVNSALNAAGLI